ncbi:MAG TPA: enoyl-CoA hydratase-related protein [Vicinamibacteria bacterium]|nr:enoyl-CoA hydratase-related protein [Vicinamibacteria bacterium]
MAAPRIDTTVDGPVARVFLARPEVRNAFDGETVRELTAAFTAVAAREDVRVVVLGGHGKVFSAGADLEWMRTVAGFSREQNLEDARALWALFDAIDRCPRPVVARVQGAALGGGAGLVAAADIAVAAEDAQFGFSEVRLGIAPAVISPWVVRRIGLSAARELFLTGERFPAHKALAIGLVRHLVPAGELDGAVAGRVAELLQAAPGAVAAVKALLRAVAGRTPEEVRETTAEVIAARRACGEGQEGLRAFLEKRRPDWAR